jgi:Protein of unknown function (DUF4056)
MAISLINFFYFFGMLFSPTRIPEKLDVNNPPPRIIRACCSFGNEVGVSGIPFLKITEITSTDVVGAHKYLGSKAEKNGIVYSKKGGFIDIAHLRDIADITAYLYANILKNKAKGKFELKLGTEAGEKTLFVTIDPSLTDEDLVKIAGKAAYDLSVWHEISTWNGASFIPLVPERYSSFSVEDAFSNLLGVHLGMRAILSSKSYESEMTRLLTETLVYYGAVNTRQETVNAMNKVEGKWWSKNAKYPSKDILILRLFDLYGCISPMLVETMDFSAERLCVPETTKAGKLLNDFYSVRIKTNFRIPISEAFGMPEHTKTITQRDFPALIAYAKKQGLKSKK